MHAEYPALEFVFKIASRCNLNCTYCYVYNKGDQTWRARPAIMSDETFHRAMHQVRNYCMVSRQEHVAIVFHGGEPCLVGSGKLASWCEEALSILHDTTRVKFSIQTNGTMLDESWIDTIKRYHISVGVSSDGPAEIHDAHRVDHSGKGSYAKVAAGIRMLQQNGCAFQVLSVIKLGADGLRVHQHFEKELGVKRISYLFPDYTHDSIAEVRRLYGTTPCADFLLPILDHWLGGDREDVKISLFWNMARLILGGSDEADLFGTHPLTIIFIEADGSVEALDVLRICRENIASTALNVYTSDLSDRSAYSAFHRQMIFESLSAPTECAGCRELLTCAGGYLPHRFSTAKLFDNRSVWCADILALFGHLRQMLNVSSIETSKRREILERIRSETRGESSEEHSCQRAGHD